MNTIIYGPPNSGKTFLMEALVAYIKSPSPPPSAIECSPLNEASIRSFLIKRRGGEAEMIFTCAIKDLLWLTKLLDKLNVHVDQHVCVSPAKSYLSVDIKDLTWTEAMREMQLLKEEDEGV